MLWRFIYGADCVGGLMEPSVRTFRRGEGFVLSGHRTTITGTSNLWRKFHITVATQTGQRWVHHKNTAVFPLTFI
jgi:hypothetical protein